MYRRVRWVALAALCALGFSVIGDAASPQPGSTPSLLATPPRDKAFTVKRGAPMPQKHSLEEAKALLSNRLSSSKPTAQSAQSTGVGHPAPTPSPQPSAAPAPRTPETSTPEKIEPAAPSKPKPMALTDGDSKTVTPERALPRFVPASQRSATLPPATRIEKSESVHSVPVATSGEKKTYDGPKNVPSPDKMGGLGDNAATPFVIGALPYNALGSTGGYADDYDEICPYLTPGSPDVVFAFTPAVNQFIEIDLCPSSYDTKVYVYQNSVTPGSTYQCNDDFCGSDGYRSFIPCFFAAGGVTHYIVVDGYGGAFGDFDFTVRNCLPGDKITSAFQIGSLPLNTFFATPGYTDDYDETCPFSAPGSPDVVYQYTPVSDGFIEIEMCASLYDTKVYVYQNGVTQGSPYQCNDDYCGSDGYKSFIPCFPVYSANTYFIVVDGYGGHSGDFSLNIYNCLPGDNFNSALPITSQLPDRLYFSDSRSTTGYTNDYDEVCPYTGSTSPDIVYSYTPTSDGRIGVDLCGSSYDTKVYVYQNFYNPGSPYVCNDDAGGDCGVVGFQSATSCFDVLAYNTYYIVVDGFGGEHGGYSMVVYDCLPACTEWAGCVPYLGLPENEACTELRDDLYNGGCVGGSLYALPIEPGGVYCGQTASSGHQFEFDYYSANLKQGDTAIFCVMGSFYPGITVWDVTDGCGAAVFLGSTALQQCDTHYVRFEVPRTGQYIFGVNAALIGYHCNDGPWEYQAWLQVICPGWAGCDHMAIPDGEDCLDPPYPDVVNGGCNYFPELFSPIVPGAKVCGTVSWNWSIRDLDWYQLPYILLEGDSVTWCATANFPFELFIEDISSGCSALSIVALGSAGPCDTLWIGTRISPSGTYTFGIAPVFGAPLLCQDGPWEYEAILNRETPCQWPGCGFGSNPEGEPCIESAVDDFNGGCFSSPEVYSPISSGDAICGTSWVSFGIGYKDTDWYLKDVVAGERLVWCVRSEFPAEVAILDLTAGCYKLVAFDYSNVCELVILEYIAPADGKVAFYVAVDAFIDWLCADGPWEYTAYLNPGPDCLFPGCHPLSIWEQEPCIEDVDIVNGGCNSYPVRFLPIAPRDRICGTVFWDGSLRDLDWYVLSLEANDTVTWCVSGPFQSVMGIVDVTNYCSQYQELALGFGAPCDTVYVTVAIPQAGDYAFVATADFVLQPYLCEHGPWEYNASLVLENCCDCHADPVCDGIQDVSDVVKAIDVAFRDGVPLLDLDSHCPYERTDVTCNNVTDVSDVVLIINVTFRNVDPAMVYCNPCALPELSEE